MLEDETGWIPERGTVDAITTHIIQFSPHLNPLNAYMC